MTTAKMNINTLEDAIALINVPSLTNQQKTEILQEQVQEWKREGKPYYLIVHLNLLCAELQLNSF